MWVDAWLYMNAGTIKLMVKNFISKNFDNQLIIKVI